MNRLPAAAGGLLAAATIIIATRLSPDRALDLLSLLLAAIAGAYVGFAAADGRLRESSIEIAAALIFLVLAACGLWLSPLLLGVGYLLHALWDLAHHSGGLDTRVPRWYLPFCALYDALVGIFVIVWWL